MKIKLFVLISFLILSSCEDVVSIDLNESEEKLVINASLNWFRNYPNNTMELGNNQKIILTKTVGYYDEVQPASGALVKVTNRDTQEVFNFIEDSNKGIYNCNNFKPILDNTYSLTVIYKEEVYNAEEKLINTSLIDSIQQIRGGFFNKDEIVLHVYFKDNINEKNYYFFDYSTSISPTKTLAVSDDRFINGNSTYQLVSYISGKDDDKKIDIGDKYFIKFYEINSFNYQYLDILTDQIYNSGIFDPIPAEVKGNIVNTTNKEHYPYGFFRILLGNKTTVTITEEELIEN